MKKSQFEKKLVLNKRLIARLNNIEMKAAQGGIGITVKWTNCNSCWISGCDCPTTSDWICC